MVHTTDEPKRRKKRKGRGQNEGTIYRGQDGRWRAIVPAKHSATGKRRMIVGSKRDGNTRAAVAKKLHAALNAQTLGVTIVPGKETVSGFLERWLQSIEPTVRPRTLESYRHTVTRMIAESIGGVKLQALEGQHVEAMLARLRHAGWAPRSVAYARSVLRIALKKAVRWRLVPRNVADDVDPPKVPRDEVDVHDSSAVSAILAHAMNADDRTLLATIATFGLRIGEALGLRWRDVNLSGNTIRIVRAVQRQAGKGLVFVDLKTARSRRALLMPPSLVEDLKSHRKRQLERRLAAGDAWVDSDLVFCARLGTPVDPRNALRILHQAETRAGLPKRGLHKLRHSAATILLGQGVPLDVVSDILGHSSIRMTKDTYTQFVIARQEGAAEAMDRAVWGANQAKAGDE
jgi:integrase